MKHVIVTWSANTVKNRVSNEAVECEYSQRVEVTMRQWNANTVKNRGNNEAVECTYTRGLLYNDILLNTNYP